MKTLDELIILQNEYEEAKNEFINFYADEVLKFNDIFLQQGNDLNEIIKEVIDYSIERLMNYTRELRSYYYIDDSFQRIKDEADQTIELINKLLR